MGKKLSLAGQIALVTGASRGIGAAVAKALAGHGAHIVAVARKQPELEQLDDAIEALGGTATLVPMDLRDGEAIDRLGATLYERFGKLDILVGNAAMLGDLTPVAHLTPGVWDRVISTNLTANYRLILSLDPLLRLSPAGRALFVTSGVVKSPHPFWGAYAVSKAGLEMLVQTYAAEVKHTAMKVALVDPGTVRTGLRASAFPGENPENLPSPESVVERFMAHLQ